MGLGLNVQGLWNIIFFSNWIIHCFIIMTTLLAFYFDSNDVAHLTRYLEIQMGVMLIIFHLKFMLLYMCYDPKILMVKGEKKFFTFDKKASQCPLIPSVRSNTVDTV